MGGGSKATLWKPEHGGERPTAEGGGGCWIFHIATHSSLKLTELFRLPLYKTQAGQITETAGQNPRALFLASPPHLCYYSSIRSVGSSYLLVGKTRTSSSISHHFPGIEPTSANRSELPGLENDVSVGDRSCPGRRGRRTCCGILQQLAALDIVVLGAESRVKRWRGGCLAPGDGCLVAPEISFRQTRWKHLEERVAGWFRR
nr:hypothetical protein Iba_chr10cCG3910 [Ipomoea batatas]